MLTNMLFAVAFAFLEREKEANYVWAIDKLRGLFIDEIEPYVIITDGGLPQVNVIGIFYCQTPPVQMIY